MSNLLGNSTHRLVDHVSDYRADQRGTKQGTFTVSMSNGVTIKGVMLHGNDNKNWILWPSSEYLKADNAKGFIPIFEFDEGVKEQINCELFNALRSINVVVKREA